MNRFPFLLSVLLLGLLGIQLIQPDLSASQTQQGDFLNRYQPKAPLGQLIRDGCYDCHSNETHYPWYARVAPLSWWIANHVQEGRAELNFSEWGAIEDRYQDEWAEKCAVFLKKEKMPLRSYQWGHPEARYTAEERAKLVDYFLTLSAEIAAANGEDEEPQNRKISK